MLDPQLTHLLETAVNTSCKMAIIIQFLENSSLRATPGELAARVCRDIWSVEAALAELAEDGILTIHNNRYVCNDSAEIRAQLGLLETTYAHPLQRDELQQMVRDLERYAPYRKELPSQFFDPFAV